MPFDKDSQWPAFVECRGRAPGRRAVGANSHAAGKRDGINASLSASSDSFSCFSENTGDDQIRVRPYVEMPCDLAIFQRAELFMTPADA